MSQLIFNPDTGMQVPETADIREAVAADWKKAFFEEDAPELNTDDTAPAGQLVDAEVAEIAAKNAQILYLSNMFNPAVSEGRWQDALGYIYFLRRKQDEPTIVNCRLTGRYGTSVPYGALARSAEGHTLICNRAVGIGEDGTAVTTFRCTETGPIEIPAGSVKHIVTTIPGWDTIENPAAGATGRNMESRSEFEARRYASVAANAHGSASAIYSAVANLNGVIDCAVLENIGPNPVTKYGVNVPGHGVTICVYGGEEADIAEAIYNKKDAGCDTGGNTEVTYLAEDYAGACYTYKILRPETVNFFVRVTLGNPEDGAPVTPALIKTVKESVYYDFLGLNQLSGNARVGLASTVYASRFYVSVMGLDMVKSLRGIDIALSETSEGASFRDVIAIRGDQEPVMTPENVIVILED